ncbi:MAG: hypothetical protein ACUVTH_11280 [Thermogutta sp.]
MTASCSEKNRLATDHSFEPETTLVVAGSSHDGKMIRVKGRVIAIGSSPHATLRLAAKGIKPVHALLIRGRVRTLFRAQNAEVTLNEQLSQEGMVQPGDILGIGPVRLIFIPGDTPCSTPNCPEVNRETNTVDEFAANPVLCSASYNQPHQIVWADTINSTGNPGGYVRPGKIAKSEVEHSTPHNAVNHEPSGETPSVPAAIMAYTETAIMNVRGEVDELKEVITELQCQLTRWTEKTEQRLADLNHLVPRLEDALEQTRQRQSAVDQMIHQLRGELERVNRMESELVRRQIDLAREQSKLDTRATLLVSREALLLQTDPAQQETPSRANFPTDSAVSLTASSTLGETEGLADNLPRLTAAEDTVATAETPGQKASKDIQGNGDCSQAEPQSRWCDAAANSSSVEPKRVEVSEGRMQDASQTPTATVPQGQPGRSTSQPVSENPEATNLEDQDYQKVIQDYLARLLARPTAPSAGEDSSHESKESPPSPGPDNPETSSVDQPRPNRSQAGIARGRGMIKKRRGAPEKIRDFAAMRELANLSSRAAIDRYAKAKLRQVQRGKLIVLLAAMLCGLALLALHLWIGFGRLGWIALALDFVVILVYGMQYGLLTGRLIIDQKGGLQLAERRIGREMRKLIPSGKPLLLEGDEPGQTSTDSSAVSGGNRA